MLNYVINKQLKKMSNQLTFYNQGKVDAGKDVALALTCKRCTSSNRKIRDRAREFIESTLTLKNDFNVMSQAALWQVMRMFQIPDVDLLEQMYEGATVRLAPDDKESATISFNQV